jgi:hypothetical protein
MLSGREAESLPIKIVNEAAEVTKIVFGDE